ncbi:hypothetical protein TNIN_381051, partial [Trichonephila inaurata madagascariensis]
MSEMETDSQIPVNDCSRKQTICNEIEGRDIVASHYEDFDKTPDTAENHEMKEILRAALKETLQKKADLCVCTNPTEIITIPKSDKNKIKKKKKKRKIKKDSSEDFAFPKKTTRPVSPL